MLRALGFEGEAAQVATREGLDLLRETNARFAVFDKTVDEIKRILGLYEHTLGEYTLYKRLLREDGFLFFHDVFWEGNPHDKGKAQAIALIDRFDPVYSIFMTDPVHRWIPRSGKGDCGGGLGIIIAART